MKVMVTRERVSCCLFGFWGDFYSRLLNNTGALSSSFEEILAIGCKRSTKLM